MHRDDVRGRVLEIGGSEYTEQFGGGRVTHVDVLDVTADNPKATVVADLTSADDLGENLYDVIILTQVLQLIFDVRAAVDTLHRLLKPGGVLLVTVCGISSAGSPGVAAASWCWSFTPRSLGRLLVAKFGASAVEVQSHGNVLTAVAFLEGMVASELEPFEFDVCDAGFPVVVSARAIKGADA
jgi:hypothetical protein